MRGGTWQAGLRWDLAGAVGIVTMTIRSWSSTADIHTCLMGITMMNNIIMGIVLFTLLTMRVSQFC